MTTDRDFDRIASAWLDLMPDRAPDRVVAEILEDVALTPQARRPLIRLPWASPRTDRLMLIAATVLLGAALVGGAVLLAGSRPSTPLPTPVTAPSAAPVPTTAASGVPGELAASLFGTWVADKPLDIGLSGPSGSGPMSLVFDTNGTAASLTTPAGTNEQFRASLTSPASDSLVFKARVASGPVRVADTELRGCKADEQGTYRATRSPDGLLLTLTAIDDPCPSRAAVFGRTWARSLTRISNGGLGVVDAFDPPFTVELPAGSYQGDTSVADAITIAQAFPEFAFLAFKNPQGFVDPCEVTAGRYEIAPGADAVVAYFRQLKGFTVDSVTERDVDGHRAVQLVVHADTDASCPNGNLAEWQPKAETTDRHWFLRPGDTDTLVIVELADATLMFQILPGPIAAGDRAIDSIRFLDQLPASP
jgi:hypothetical protein